MAEPGIRSHIQAIRHLLAGWLIVRIGLTFGISSAGVIHRPGRSEHGFLWKSCGRRPARHRRPPDPHASSFSAKRSPPAPGSPSPGFPQGYPQFSPDPAVLFPTFLTAFPQAPAVENRTKLCIHRKMSVFRFLRENRAGPCPARLPRQKKQPSRESGRAGAGGVTSAAPR